MSIYKCSTHRSCLARLASTYTCMKEIKKDRYKEKKCPICSKLHKKRWDCCSMECGYIRKNQTPVTEQAKRNISAGLKRFKQTPEGELTNMNLLNFKKEENVAILPPQFIDTPYFVEDGDVWSLA